MKPHRTKISFLPAAIGFLLLVASAYSGWEFLSPNEPRHYEHVLSALRLLQQSDKDIVTDAYRLLAGNEISRSEVEERNQQVANLLKDLRAGYVNEAKIIWGAAWIDSVEQNLARKSRLLDSMRTEVQSGWMDTLRIRHQAAMLQMSSVDKPISLLRQGFIQKYNAIVKIKSYYAYSFFVCLSLLFCLVVFYLLWNYRVRNSLRKINFQLEKRVEERTRELQNERSQILETNANLRLLSLVASKADSSILITNADGNVLWSNEAFETMSGYSSSEITGKKPEELLKGPFTDEASIRQLQRSQGKGQSYTGEILYYHKGGYTFWVQLQLIPVFNEKSELESFIRIERDITEQKRSRETMRLSEERYRQMFENNPMPMYVFEVENLKILAANNAANEKYGYFGKALEEISVSEIFMHDDLPAFVGQLKKPGRKFLSDCRHKLPDGRVLEVEITADEIEFGNQPAMLLLAHDVTDRNEARRRLDEGQERIKQSEESYRIIFDSSPLPIAILDTETLSFLNVNHAAIEHYGYSKEEFLELKLPDICLSPKTDGSQTDEKEIDGFWKHRTKNNSIIDVELSSHLLRIDRQEVRLVIIRDITEEKQAERALIESEERFSTFMRYNAATAWIKDKEGRHIYINKKFEEQFHVSLAEAIGKTDFELLPQESAMQTTHTDRQVLETGQPLEIEERLAMAGGKVHYWQVYKFPLTNSNGERFIGGIAFDVTDKKKAELALLESEKRYRLISQNVHDVIALHKPEGHFTFLSPSVKELFGYAPEELAGTLPCDKIHPDDIEKIMLFQHELMRHRKPATTEIRVRKKDGDYIWMDVMAQPIFEESKLSHVQTVSRDISDRKKAEEEIRNYMNNLKSVNGELVKAKEVAEHSVRVKEEFMANMSHEIRTPMNAIIGLTRLLLNAGPTHEQEEYLRAIAKSGDSLMVIINDILDLSKMEAGKMTFEAISFNVKDTLDFINHLMLPKAEDKGLSLQFHVDENVPKVIVGDPVRLNQVLLNLIGNALKFTQDGGVDVYVEKLRESSKAIDLRFSITDSGIGIPADRLGEIFNSFTQGGSHINRKYGGTGLGLAIVKRLVDLQGGKIEVSSKPGEGSTFRFVLPFAVNEQLEVKPMNGNNMKNHVIKSSPDLKGKRVLLVEDNPINQMVAKQTLRDFGMSVHSVDNGQIAIDTLQKESFDLVLMDVLMPEMDGYEATRWIRQNFSFHIPILAMTAHAGHDEEKKCREAGMDDYISKPFDTAVLQSKIIALIYNYPHHNTKEKVMEKENKLQDQKRLSDLTYLKGLADGNHEFVEEMLQMFINMVPTSVNELSAYLEQKDWRNIKVTAHKIKPSFGFIGHHDGEKVLQKIETLASDLPDPIVLKDLIAQACSFTSQLVEELKEELMHKV